MTAKIKFHTIVEPLIVGDMTRQQVIVTMTTGSGKATCILGSRVTAHIMIVHKVGGCADVEGHLRGSIHTDALTSVDLSGRNLAIACDFGAALSRQFRNDAFVVHTFDDGNQCIAIDHRLVVVVTLVIEEEAHSCRWASLEANHNNAVGHRSKCLSREKGIIGTECHFGSGIHEVELAFIVGDFAKAVVQNLQTAQREVLHAVGSHDESAIHDFLGFVFTTLENHITHSVQIVARRCAVIVMRSTAPECLFIELDFILLHATIDHGSHTGISQWKCFEPRRSRLVVPESLVIILRIVFGTCRQNKRSSQSQK